MWEEGGVNYLQAVVVVTPRAVERRNGFKIIIYSQQLRISSIKQDHIDPHMIDICAFFEETK